MKPTDVFFFANGNTAVTDGQSQIPELQQPWLLKFVEFLQELGIDVKDIRFHLPTGVATLFPLEDGRFNWQFTKDEHAS